MDPIRIAMFFGSESDFSQCVEGFEALMKAEAKNKIELVCISRRKPVNVNSIHRHHKTTVHNLKKVVGPKKMADVIIAGAGMSAHLPGMIDSILRYEVGDVTTPVIAVAFKGSVKKKTLAATYSIRYVPGTQVVFNRHLVGKDAFVYACRLAIKGKFTRVLKTPETKKAAYYSLSDAIAIGKSQREKKKEKEVK